MYYEDESNDTYYVDDNQPITNEIIEEIIKYTKIQKSILEMILINQLIIYPVDYKILHLVMILINQWIIYPVNYKILLSAIILTNLSNIYRLD